MAAPRDLHAQVSNPTALSAEELVGRARPIFLLSHFRCGSTLVRYALDAHPAICCPAEIRLGAFSWQTFKVFELLTADGSIPDCDLSAHRARSVRHVVDTVMRSYCLRKGKTRWCDKSPANVEALHVLTSVFPDAQYICLHRHGLDQVRSALEDDELRPEPLINREDGNLTAAAISKWCTNVERLLTLEHSHDFSVYRLRYEDFVHDPTKHLADVMSFLGLEMVHDQMTLAFQKAHDRGPSDRKIVATDCVRTDRIGRGRSIDLDGIAAALRARFAKLMEELGYV